MSKLLIHKAVLVYQGGIANVFAVDYFNMTETRKRNARRLMQGTFDQCELAAQGLGIAGTEVISAVCNEAGDIINSRWSDELDDAPFSRQFRPIAAKGGTFVPQHILQS